MSFETKKNRNLTNMTNSNMYFTTHKKIICTFPGFSPLCNKKNVYFLLNPLFLSFILVLSK